jgi:dGTPase
MIHFSPALAEAERGLKAFLFDNVYRSEQVMAPVRRSQDVVSALFDAYLGGAPMPGRWAEAWRRSGSGTGRARIVCDFVAGMTDPYAEEQHTALFDAKARIG